VDTAVQASDNVPSLRQQGRPRDASREAAILEAALALVGELGYDRVSMDAVAARARASKATIYRRWSSKGALVSAAVRCRAPVPMVMPDEGSLRADLLAAVRLMTESIGQQDLALLTGVFAGMRTDPELADAMRCDLLGDKESAIAPLFQRAAERGEPLHTDAVRLFLEVAPAVVMHRLIVTAEAVDDAYVTHVVDDVLLPVLTTPSICSTAPVPEGPRA
jgi:AcrR family transcriptional regulator